MPMKLLRTAALSAVFLTASLSVTMAGTPADQLVVGMNMTNFISLDPPATSGRQAFEITSNIYDHLLELDPKDRKIVRPALAESWEVSPDGTTITLKMRKDAKFHSGNPVTANDFVWSLTRAFKQSLTQATTWKSFGFNADNVAETIMAPDPQTVVIKIPNPTDPVLVVNTIAIIPSSLVIDSKLAMEHEKDGDMGSAWLAANDAGSGPFILKSWQTNNLVMLERFDDHWSGPAKMKRVIYRHMPEPQSQRLAIEKGDIDVASGMAGPDIKALANDPNIKLDEVQSGNIYYLGMSLKHEKYQNPKVRAAVRLLIDYEGINTAIMPYFGFPHQRPIQHGSMGDLPDPGFKLDVEGAKKLLAEAGYPDGFEATIRVLPDSPFINIATSIQATLAQGGIKAEILPGSGDQVYGSMRKRDFDMIVGRGGGGRDPHPHGNMRSQIYNPDNRDEAKLTSFQGWRSSFHNEELNKMILAALLERNKAKQEQMYKDIQNKVAEVVQSLLPISQAVDTIVYRADVQNYVYHPCWTTYLKGVYKQR